MYFSVKLIFRQINIIRILLFVGFLSISLSSCDILNQLGEAKRFAQCEFEIKTVKIHKLGGVDLQNYQKPEDINFMELMLLGQKILSGNLKAEMEVNIQATNNDTRKASISGVEWQVFMKDEIYGQGKLNDYVEVLPTSSANFSVDVNFDLMKLISSEKLQTILDVVFNKSSNKDLQELDISVKLKPFYSSGDKIHEYPGFITIRP